MEEERRVERPAGARLALSGQAGYDAAFPDCNWMNADCNEDGSVNLADIDPFVAILGGGK